MPIIPVLTTPRLVMRSFVPEDAPAVQAYLQDKEMASTTATVPYPYPEGAAEAWIAGHAAKHEAGEAVILAITLRDAGTLVGCMTMRIDMAHRRGELGFWVGRAHWGRGYATEAADAIMRWGLRTLGLHRVHAANMTRNPASGAVLRKIGMRHEGTLRGHLLKWGMLEDLEVWGILEDEVEEEDRQGPLP
jgi:[ribosomal protein S5]-alanine N-acetyltransferase